jgi:hypothetical protein
VGECWEEKKEYFGEEGGQENLPQQEKKSRQGWGRGPDHVGKWEKEEMENHQQRVKNQSPHQQIAVVKLLRKKK